MAIKDLDKFLRTNYDVYEANHASAVLLADFPEQWDDLAKVLTKFRLTEADIRTRGGNLGPISRKLDAIN